MEIGSFCFGVVFSCFYWGSKYYEKRNEIKCLELGVRVNKLRSLVQNEENELPLNIDYIASYEEYGMWNSSLTKKGKQLFEEQEKIALQRYQKERHK